MGCLNVQRTNCCQVQAQATFPARGPRPLLFFTVTEAFHSRSSITICAWPQCGACTGVSPWAGGPQKLLLEVRDLRQVNSVILQKNANSRKAVVKVPTLNFSIIFNCFIPNKSATFISPRHPLPSGSSHQDLMLVHGPAGRAMAQLGISL